MNDQPTNDQPTNDETVQIRFLNNDGGGFADQLVIAAGTTVREFLLARFSNLGAYTIKVNGQHIAGDYKLVEGDRLSVTPKKQDGN